MVDVPIDVGVLVASGVLLGTLALVGIPVDVGEAAGVLLGWVVGVRVGEGVFTGIGV
jgi:hypothetical protein